jgi:hypothetical protein
MSEEDFGSAVVLRYENGIYVPFRRIIFGFSPFSLGTNIFYISYRMLG